MANALFLKWSFLLKCGVLPRVFSSFNDSNNQPHAAQDGIGVKKSIPTFEGLDSCECVIEVRVSELKHKNHRHRPLLKTSGPFELNPEQVKLDRPLNPLAFETSSNLVQSLASSHAAKPRRFICNGSESKALAPGVVRTAFRGHSCQALSNELQTTSGGYVALK